MKKSTAHRYVDVRAVHRLIGANFPHGAVHLAESIEEYLRHVTSSGDSLPENLLAHNLSGHRVRHTCELAAIDADIQFTSDASVKKLNMEMKDYRVHTQLARPLHERRVVLHLHIKHPDRTDWSISLPLQALMKGFGDVEDGYQCYSHSIALFDEDADDDAKQSFDDSKQIYYCGITSRNWLKRMAEHLAEVRNGSNKTFHAAWRAYQGRRGVLLGSELVVLNHSYNGAMGWEEMLVDRYIAEKRSLNMIPGGFKGLKFLHQLGLLARTANVSEAERDAAVLAYVRKRPRSGVPNMLISGLWKNDDFYTKVITGRSNTLSVEQVRAIRTLASQGESAAGIASKVGARNIEQVERVLNGKTYSRIQGAG